MFLLPVETKRPARGGAEGFALIFILLLGAVIGLYFFYYLPAQQAAKPDRTPSADADRRDTPGESDPISLDPPRRQNGIGSTTTNTDPNGGHRPASGTDSTARPDSSTTTTGSGTSTDAPSTDDSRAQPIVASAEALVMRGRWDEAIAEIGPVLKMKLSEKLAERAARVDSQARIMKDFTGIESARVRLAADEPIPLRLTLHGGGLAVGSVFPKVLDQIYRASHGGRALPTRWSAFEPSVDARQIRGEFMLQRQAGGYESIRYQDIARVAPIAERDWDRYFEERVKKLREIYEQSEKSPVDRYLFARGLKRHAPARADNHEWVQEAKQLIESALADDPYLYQSSRLERSETYQAYLIAVRQGDSRRANRQLDTLLDQFPFARQLSAAKAARAAGEDAAQKMEALVNDEADRGSRQETDLRVERSGALRDAMTGSRDQLLDEARKFFNQAQQLDERALPGRPNFREDLEQAIYLYGCTRELLNRAAERGADAAEVDALRIKVNKAIFWCHKRKPIF